MADEHVLDFKSMISEVEFGLTCADFTVGVDKLWVPEFGFSHDEKEAVNQIMYF